MRLVVILEKIGCSVHVVLLWMIGCLELWIDIVVVSEQFPFIFM